MIADLPLFAAASPERDVLMDALDRAFESVPVGSLVTAESLRDKLSQPAREQLQVPTRKNLLGQYFMRLAKTGRVEHDGWTEAQRSDARHRALRRWRRVA
jgi:hypothetical protein